MLTGSEPIDGRADPPDEQLRHHFGVEGGSARSDAAHRVEELLDVGHPVFEQIADGSGRAAEQFGGIPFLDVLAEDKDGDAGPPLAEFQRRSDPFVGPGRRHPDVNDREIRTELRDRLDERGRRIDRRDRLDAGDG